MHLLHALATGHKVSRRGQLPRATQLPPTSYSLSNVRADLGVGSNCSMGKGLGAAGRVVAREDHSGYDDGQGQPQPQQHHADGGPAALSHGSAAQERGEAGGQTGQWTDKCTSSCADGQTRRFTYELTDDRTDGHADGGQRQTDGLTDKLDTREDSKRRMAK